MEQMRGKIKRSCLRSWATGWGVPVCLSCLAPLLLWGPSQLIKKVFIGMPGVHLWVIQSMMATSIYSQAQGSPLNNNTSYEGKTQMCVEAASCMLHCSCKMHCRKTLGCDRDICCPHGGSVSSMNWHQWHSLTTVVLRSDQMPFKREKVLWKWGAVMCIKF